MAHRNRAVMVVLICECVRTRLEWASVFTLSCPRVRLVTVAKFPIRVWETPSNVRQCRSLTIVKVALCVIRLTVSNIEVRPLPIWVMVSLIVSLIPLKLHSTRPVDRAKVRSRLPLARLSLHLEPNLL